MEKAKKEQHKLLKFKIPKGFEPFAYEWRGKELYVWIRKYKYPHAIAFKL